MLFQDAFRTLHDRCPTEAEDARGSLYFGIRVQKSVESLQKLYLSTAVCGNGATIVLLKVVSGGSKCTTLHLQW